jgi:hypothetical protein
MRESPRVRANRANAQRSTGPKSVAGKAAVSRNALKHELSIPIERMIGYNPQIERLAKRIAGENPSGERFEYAYQMASALLDVRRVRGARIKLLRDPVERIKEQGYKCGGGEYSLEESFAVLAPKLERLDRYERRACTRFRKALRLFDLHLPEPANPTEPPADQ